MNRACCHICNKPRESFVTITVNDVPRHYCARCWQAVRADFLGKLLAGDERAQRIYALVSMVAKETKSDD